MRNLFKFLTGIAFAVLTINATAQTTSELKKEAAKQAKTEAAKFDNESWKPEGDQTLEKMLEKYWFQHLQKDKNGQALYFEAEGSSLNTTANVAKLQAVENAKQLLCKQIATEINLLISGKITTSGINASDSVKIASVLSTSSSIICQKLGYVQPVLSFQRKNKSAGNAHESLVRILFEQAKALSLAKELIRSAIVEKCQLPDEKLKLLFDF